MSMKNMANARDSYQDFLMQYFPEYGYFVPEMQAPGCLAGEFGLCEEMKAEIRLETLRQKLRKNLP